MEGIIIKVITLAVYLFSYFTYAQSFYQDYGESGAEISAFMIFNENSNMYLGPKIGYSIKGQLDLGVKLGSNIFIKNENIKSQKSLDITPYLLFHFFKQGDSGMPLSALSGIGYKYGKTDIDYKEGTASETYPNYVVVTYGLYRDFNLDNNFRLQPRFIFELNLGQTEFTYYNLIETKDSLLNGSTKYFEISLPVIYSSSEGHNYFITPLIAFSEDYTLYGFFLGLTF